MKNLSESFFEFCSRVAKLFPSWRHVPKTSFDDDLVKLSVLFVRLDRSLELILNCEYVLVVVLADIIVSLDAFIIEKSIFIIIEKNRKRR